MQSLFRCFLYLYGPCHAKSLILFIVISFGCDYGYFKINGGYFHFLSLISGCGFWLEAPWRNYMLFCVVDKGTDGSCHFAYLFVILVSLNLNVLFCYIWGMDLAFLYTILISSLNWFAFIFFLRNDIISLRSEREKFALEARFAEENLGRFMKDIEHQVDMCGAAFYSYRFSPFKRRHIQKIL